MQGAFSRDVMAPDASPEGLRRSVDTCLKALDGKKKIDLFECARVDPKVTITETMKSLKALVDEGKFDHVGLSEVSAKSVKEANSVSTACCHLDPGERS